VALVTYLRYVELTQDTTSASVDVNTQLEIAQELVTDALGRTLESTEVTEDLRVYVNGTVYPTVTPVTVAPTDVTIKRNGYTLTGVASDYFDATTDLVNNYPEATITYTGGWTSSTVPVSVARCIASLAQALLVGNTTASLGSGASSIKVGNVSISYGDLASGATTLSRLVDAAIIPLETYRRRRP
jgi:hypothetical protein